MSSCHMCNMVFLIAARLAFLWDLHASTYILARAAESAALNDANNFRVRTRGSHSLLFSRFRKDGPRNF